MCYVVTAVFSVVRVGVCYSSGAESVRVVLHVSAADDKLSFPQRIHLLLFRCSLFSRRRHLLSVKYIVLQLWPVGQLGLELHVLISSKHRNLFGVTTAVSGEPDTVSLCLFTSSPSYQPNAAQHP